MLESGDTILLSDELPRKTSILSPEFKRGNRAFGPGHCCVVEDRGGKLWMVYHQQKDDSQKWNRFICIDPLWFDEKGILHGRATRGTPRRAPAAVDPEEGKPPRSRPPFKTGAD
jgi:hypothetical protein